MTSGIGPKYTRDELLDVVRRHVHAYKDDETFSQSIMDIAEFLVEYRAYKRRHEPEPDTNTGIQRRRWLRSTEQRDEELKLILQRHNRTRATTCRLCGGPTEGRAMCPNCGNMTV
jgi:rubrerythrin